jgi:hypothetical protein
MAFNKIITNSPCLQDDTQIFEGGFGSIFILNWAEVEDESSPEGRNKVALGMSH